MEGSSGSIHRSLCLSFPRFHDDACSLSSFPRDWILSVSQPKDRDDRWPIVFLRDLLRAIGIAAVLMSTHSGAHKAVRSGSGSSNTYEDSRWCDLITRLPRFHSSKPVADMSPYLCGSERPLIAQFISEMARDISIDDMVSTIRKKLQRKKTWCVDDQSSVPIVSAFSYST